MSASSHTSVAATRMRLQILLDEHTKRHPRPAHTHNGGVLTGFQQGVRAAIRAIDQGGIKQ